VKRKQPVCFIIAGPNGAGKTWVLYDNSGKKPVLLDAGEKQ
jgi:predicted ABC-type ATPase